MSDKPALRNYRLLFMGEQIVSAWSEAAAISIVAHKIPENAVVIVRESHPVLTIEPPDTDE